jgi:hypothetical protein
MGLPYLMRDKNLSATVAISASLLLASLGCATPSREPEPSVRRLQINCSSPQRLKTEVYELSAEKFWQLTVPGNSRFDASGLVMKNGRLYTVNDRGPELFEIELGENGASVEATGIFRPEALRKVSGVAGRTRFDTEGIALDDRGRIYICEESDREVFRWDGKEVSRVPLDLEPVKQLFSEDQNASFEGVAVGNGKLYLANERERPVVIVIELASGEVVENFYVQSQGFAFGGPHYSDLAWFEGRLFILDRNFRCILEVDPASHALIAQYNFGKMESQPEVAYQTQYPTGTMEGLAVTSEYFYLVTDNNGLPRKAAKSDVRPTLFKVRRPASEQPSR